MKQEQKYLLCYKEARDQGEGEGGLRTAVGLPLWSGSGEGGPS